MAKKFLGFTPDQQYTLLNKLGYSGPKDSESMQQFLASSPSASAKMGQYAQKAQERLDNYTLKLAEGGTVDPAQAKLDDAQQKLADTTSSGGTQKDIKAAQKDLTAAQTAFNLTNVPTTAEMASTAINKPETLTTQAEAAKIVQTPDQLIAQGTGQVTPAAPITAATVTEPAQATAPTQTATNTFEASTTQSQTETALQGATAATAEPSKAATVQGQLEGLMAQFEGGATPPWASGAMRQAMGIMQQRGLGASSMAGQAVVQAAMESAISIASQDAQTTAQFEMQNLNNQQQTMIFKTQQRIASIFTDQAADNAAKQFNAASKNQTDQFFAGLQESVSRFNADQINATLQFNAGQENAISQFNTQLKAQQDQFNAQNSLVIAQANAQWRQNVATLDTAAQNEANMTNAKLNTAMTQAAMDQLWQRERDLMSFAFTSSESALDRRVSLINGNKTLEIAKLDANATEKAGMGQLLGSIVGSIF